MTEAAFIFWSDSCLLTYVFMPVCMLGCVSMYLSICARQQTPPISRVIVRTSKNTHGILRLKKKSLQTENVLQGSRKRHFQIARPNNG